MHLKKEHKIDVLIRSAQDISKKSIQRIARAIHSYTGKNADMHLCVDQELWMGMTVMWNHFMIDVSLGKTYTLYTSKGLFKNDDIFSKAGHF